jgi:uncharacterized protein YdeI (YjbR/CyaY-like superfamily)
MGQEVLFFETAADLRNWLHENHQTSPEQWIGFYKKETKIPSITWPESVDQALCFGWIDGLRKSIDEKSYKIRFTPRRASSHWSAVNIARIQELQKLKLLKPAGLAAYSKRNPDRSRQASHEQTKNVELEHQFQKQLEEQPRAWKNFQQRPPSYRKQCIWWVISAKKIETREKRLQILIDSCDQGQKIPPLRWQK